MLCASLPACRTDRLLGGVRTGNVCTPPAEQPPPAADLRCPLHRRAHRGVVAAISASTAPAQPRYLIRAPRAATSDSPIAIGVPRPRESGRAACCLSGRLQMEAKRLCCALCRSRCSGLHVVTALWERAQPSLGLGGPGNAGAALGLRSAPPESSVSPGRGLKGCCRAVMKTQSEDMAHQGRPWADFASWSAAVSISLLRRVEQEWERRARVVQGFPGSPGRGCMCHISAPGLLRAVRHGAKQAVELGMAGRMLLEGAQSALSYTPSTHTSSPWPVEFGELTVWGCCDRAR